MAALYLTVLPVPTKLIAVIGFPFGDIPHNFKQAQAEWAAEQGADELDIVPSFQDQGPSFVLVTVFGPLALVQDS